MRRAALLTGVLCAVTVLALLMVSLLQRTELAFTLGVAPALPVVKLEPDSTVCQTPLLVPNGGEFDRVALTLGAGSGVELTLREVKGGPVLARAEVPGGRRAGEREVRVKEVPSGANFDACLTNGSDRTVQVFGNPDAASRTSTAWLDGKPVGVDVALRFDREPRSMFSLIGDMFDRASLFKFSWTGPWALWLLAAVVLIGVPALLVRALRGVEE